MTADQPEQGRFSVMLTLDAGSYSLPIVDLAVEMAASLQAHIHGLFIENEDLLHTAGFPFSHEISLPTARQRPTDIDSLQRSLRSMAGQFKKYLEQTARASSLQWSYDYVRGRTGEIGLTGDSDVTYRIFGQVLHHRSPGRRHQRPRRLLLLEDHSARLLNALQIVLRRLEPDRVEISLVRNTPEETTAVTALLQQAAEQMQRLFVVELDYDRILQQLADSSMNFDYVIASQHTPIDILRRIIRQACCPVILVA